MTFISPILTLNSNGAISTICISMLNVCMKNMALIRANKVSIFDMLNISVRKGLYRGVNNMAESDGPMYS